MNDMEELIRFLKPDQRIDLKSASCMSVAQLTGTPEGLVTVYKAPALVEAVMALRRDEETFTAKDAMRVLVNVSAEYEGSRVLLNMEKLSIVEKMVELIEDKEYEHADFACGVLANLSRKSGLSTVVLEHLSKTQLKLEGLVFIFCQPAYNVKGAKLHLLAPVLTNFAQTLDGRRQLMSKEKCILQRLLPFTQFKGSIGRRNSIIATIHNCCFEKDYHDWLLSDDVDLTSYLCLPLAGPDVFTAEENESLPLDLQFLDDDKTREEDVEIRRLLLESIMQLCTTKRSRERLREVNIYLVMREHHKWEQDRECVALNEDIVNLLIRTEEEIGFEDLSTIQIPSELCQKFAHYDVQDALEEGEKSTDTNSLQTS